MLFHAFSRLDEPIIAFAKAFASSRAKSKSAASSASCDDDLKPYFVVFLFYILFQRA